MSTLKLSVIDKRPDYIRIDAGIGIRLSWAGDIASVELFCAFKGAVRLSAQVKVSANLVYLTVFMGNRCPPSFSSIGLVLAVLLDSKP